MGSLLQAPCLATAMVLPGATDSSHDLTGKGSFFFLLVRVRFFVSWWSQNCSFLLITCWRLPSRQILGAGHNTAACFTQSQQRRMYSLIWHRHEYDILAPLPYSVLLVRNVSKSPLIQGNTPGHTAEDGVTGLHLTVWATGKFNTGKATDPMWVQT